MNLRIRAIELAVRDLLAADAFWGLVIRGPYSFGPGEIPGAAVVVGQVTMDNPTNGSMRASAELVIEAHDEYDIGAGEEPATVGWSMIERIRDVVEVQIPDLENVLRTDQGAHAKGRLGLLSLGIVPNRDGASGVVSVQVRYAVPHMASFGEF